MVIIRIREREIERKRKREIEKVEKKQVGSDIVISYFILHYRQVITVSV